MAYPIENWAMVETSHVAFVCEDLAIAGTHIQSNTQDFPPDTWAPRLKRSNSLENREVSAIRMMTNYTDPKYHHHHHHHHHDILRPLYHTICILFNPDLTDVHWNPVYIWIIDAESPIQIPSLVAVT